MVGELKRLFLAVPVDPAVQSMLSQHLSSLSIPGKVVPPANWHLTVRFLGWLDQIRTEIVTSSVDGADLGKPFQLVLGGMGAFPRPGRAGVVWLGLARGEAELARLNRVTEEAAQAAGLEGEERPFASHLTLSRIRPPADVSPLVEGYRAQPFGWKAQELILFQSRPGPEYLEVERFRLESRR
jgi:2'-5' RNA ligase